MASMQQTYEDFKPLMEEKDTPDALLLLVHIPGFTREQIGASFEGDSRKIKVFGEKPIDNNRRKRFKEEYVIPETCDCDKPTGKFDGTVITITIPKKPISSVTPKEPTPAEETAKQVTPPTSTSGVEAERAIKKDEKGVSQEKPKPETESQREADEKKDETQIPPEATTAETEKPQKDKEEIHKKGSFKEEEKHKDKMETKDASTPEKAKPETESQREADEKKDETQIPPEATMGETEKPQQDKEEIPKKGSFKDEEKHKDEMDTKDASTPEKAKGESRISQKDQEGTHQKGELDDEKKHEENKAEKERIQEDKRKTSEAGKEPQKVQTLAREANKDKGSSGLKTPQERKKESELPIAKGIKDVANSASQAVTRLADRFKEEDKQKLLYAGAAILIVAVGIYAAFKLRSTGRQ